jgi:hypothetical protein
MEEREHLRLLSLEMEMQRAWLADYLDAEETRAATRRRNLLLKLAMSALRTQSLWVAALGAATQWYRSTHRRPHRPAA